MTQHQDDPTFLKALTEVEKANLLPNELASDGRSVVAGIDPPTEDELLEFLHEQGFGPGDEGLLR